MVSATGLKNDIIRINNQVNMDLYGHGLKSQKIYFVEDEMILIIANNKRISALATLDSCGYDTTDINRVLLEVFKKRLKQDLEKILGIRILSVHKDYDHMTQTAATTVILAEPLKEMGP